MWCAITQRYRPSDRVSLNGAPPPPNRPRLRPDVGIVSRDSRWRIVAVDDVSPELAAEGFEATWIVEPLEVIRRDNWRVWGAYNDWLPGPSLGLMRAGQGLRWPNPWPS